MKRSIALLLSVVLLLGASIGYSFRYYMDGIVGNDEVKMLSLNGVFPTAENICSGAYGFIPEKSAGIFTGSHNFR